MEDSLGAALFFDQAFQVEAVAKKDRQKGPDPDDRDIARRRHIPAFLSSPASSFIHLLSLALTISRRSLDG